MLKKKIVITLVEDLVGHPTQLICIWIIICSMKYKRHSNASSIIDGPSVGYIWTLTGYSLTLLLLCLFVFGLFVTFRSTTKRNKAKRHRKPNDVLLNANGDEENCVPLEPSHTHFLLVDDGSVGTLLYYASFLMVFFCQYPIIKWNDTFL